MDDLIDKDVELVQDLLDLGVVFVSADRLGALLREQDVALSCDADVLEKRRALLENLPVLPYGHAESISSNNSTTELEGDHTEEEDEVVLYVKYDLVYPESEEDADASSDESVEDGPRGSTNTKASDSFFSELFPTKEVTKQRNLLGSFPDIADFEGGIEFVGMGFSGLVFKSTLDGVPVVLKVSKKKNAEANRADYNEWSISDRLKPHPNVLQVFGLCPSFQHPYYQSVGTTAIISPWQENGALRAFYDKRTQTQKRDDLQNAALGMVRGIRSLHEQGVVHRDIAVRNFLVDIDGRVMLCDFGLTRFIPDGEDHIGIALFELVEKTTPWPNFRNPDDFRRAMEAKQLKVPAMHGVRPIIADIVRDCLQFDPALRPTANDVAERLVRWQFRYEDLRRDDHGNTRLHQLAASDEYSKIEDLFRVGSPFPVMVNAVNNSGETPLMLGDYRTVDILLEYQKVPSTNEEPSKVAECFHSIDVFGALHKLVERQDVEQIKTIDKGLQLWEKNKSSRFVPSTTHDEYRGSNGETPLHTAARLANIELFDALLDLQVIHVWKTNNEGRTALHLASLHGHVVIMKKLLALADASEENSDVANTRDKLGKTALHLATASGNVSAIGVLLNSSATNVNLRDFEGRPPMFDITLADNIDAPTRVELLQAFVHHPDIDLHAKDSTGETMMHKVARYDLALSTEVLLQLSRGDVYMPEKAHQYLPIHLSIREKSFNVAAILFKSQMDINKSDKYGNTLLHLLADASSSPREALDEVISMKVKLTETLVSRDDVDLNLCNSRGDTALHIAIAKNNLTVVKAILSSPGEKLRINQRDRKLRTPLLLAIDGGKSDIFKMIMSRSEVDVTAADEDQQTPLHLACIKNAAEVAIMLLSRDGVDVSAADEYLRTPLHFASSSNAVEIAAMLLSRDEVNINARDKRQETPLHSACNRNATEVATMLLSRDDVDIDAADVYQITPLHLASSSNAAEIATMLLSRDDVDVNVRDNRRMTPLHRACNSNAVEVVKILLSRYDVDLGAADEYLRTPLHLASIENAAEIAASLLSRYDVDVGARDMNQMTPLHCASAANAAEVATMLLARDDVDVNARDKRQETPLHWASAKNAAEVASMLLARDDVDVNARDEDQLEAMHWASRRNATEVAKMLLSRDDVDVNVRDIHERTPLHWTSKENVAKADKRQETPEHWGSEENAAKVVGMLLSRDDVDVNARDEDERTPLHWASVENAAEVAKMLLSRGDVDVNVRDIHERTPLHWASKENAAKVAKMLLSRDDVDVRARDKEGKTPLDYATQSRSAECIALLGDIGVDLDSHQ